MTKKRMGAKSNDGLLAIAEMVRKFSERILDYKSPPTLSEALVELLNGEKNFGTSKERVNRIIQLLRIQQGYATQLRAGLRNKRLADMLISSMIEFNIELNERLSHYKIIPQIDPLGAVPTLSYLAADTSRTSREDEAEVAAVMCALQLAQRNQLDNVRECACHQFFVAGRIDQNYCSVKCRVKAHQSSEEFKAKRREADRERYRLHHDGKVKETNNRRKNGTQKTR